MGSRNPAAHRRRLGSAFNRLWVGFALASSGDGLAAGAVPLLTITVNPHPLAVSAVVAADSLPWLLMALPAGTFADRFQRGPVAVLSNGLRAFIIVLSALLILSDKMTLTLLILIVLVNASARTFFYSSYQALVPEIIDTRDLEHANGVLTGTEAATEHLAGPVAGTSLFAVAASLPFFADAIALVASCIPFLRFRSRATNAGSSTSMWEGVRFLLADRRLRVLIAMVGSLSLLQGMEFGVLVLLATTKWGVREGAYGFFLAAGATGNLVGSVLADGWVRRFGSGGTLLGAAVVSGLGYLVMASATSWALAGPAFVLVGIAVGAGAVVANSVRQRLTPHDMMGRVGSAARGIVWGAAPIGALAAGGLATLSGLKAPLVVAGVLQCVVALLLARPLLRNIQDDRRRGTSTGRRRRVSGNQGIPPQATPSGHVEPRVSVTAIAHRGEPVGARENTLPAFAAAVALGADMVELDLRLTRDGQTVVLHDQTLERLWDVHASVADLDLDEVQQIGEGDVRIPTFREVLAAVEKPLMVDFTRREVVADGLASVREAGALERSLFVTGNVEALRILRVLSAEARIGLTWVEGPEPPLGLLDELRAEYWNPMFGLVTGDGVAAVHAAGLRVSTWTVDAPEDMARVVSAGVDAVVSNRVADLVAFLGR